VRQTRESPQVFVFCRRVVALARLRSGQPLI
jgi:hypothetical protein